MVIAGFVWLRGGEAKGPSSIVAIDVVIDGYSSEDTLIPVEISGTASNGETFNEVQFVDAAGSGISVPVGSYLLTFPASPLTTDGILYEVPDDVFNLRIPDGVPEGSSYHANSVKAEFKRSTALDETDSMIEQAHRYALMDESQASKANKLYSIAKDVHEKAVEEEKSKKESSGSGDSGSSNAPQTQTPTPSNPPASSQYPSVAPSSVYYVCASEFVTLRVSPSTNSTAITRIPSRYEVTLITHLGNGWSEVSFGGRTGYVISKFISTDRNAPLVYDDV